MADLVEFKCDEDHKVKYFLSFAYNLTGKSHVVIYLTFLTFSFKVVY